MTCYLVCEGDPTQLDLRVLDKIIAQKMNLPILVKSAGGENSVKAVAGYLEDSSRPAPDKPAQNRGYSIRDRNYHPLPIVQASAWNQPNCKHFIWRRHEIENYLLEPEVIFTLFEGWRQDNIRGSDRLPDTLGDVEATLRILAQPLLENHAGELALYDLKGKRSFMDLSWKESSRKRNLPMGQRYWDQNTWINYLVQESLHLKTACNGLSVDPDFEQPALRQRYLSALEGIRDPTFFNNGQFLCDLDGHALMWEFWNWVHGLGISINREDLGTQLIDALNHCYHPGLFSPNDFEELANRLI